ncbi:MAG: hypothetical protein H7A45_18945 [Verrucomicrobiales bacterium]|nr:hypothetical protein [Verrucomicrobiales bacterium]
MPDALVTTDAGAGGALLRGRENKVARIIASSPATNTPAMIRGIFGRSPM